jgi:hypothetical protein
MNIFTNNHSRTVTYQADIQASGNWYLSLYGWTKSPLIEFYVVEAFGSYDPSSAATSVGTAEIDGSTYTLLQTTRTTSLPLRVPPPSSSTGPSARSTAPAAPSTSALTSMPGRVLASTLALSTT